VFSLVRYVSAAGPLKAYVTPDPGDGAKHPAIVWITGGDCNSIGEIWHPAPPDNDQTAAAYRNAGIVMMFPSLRGGNDNPGRREGFLGEVDDVIAAADFLAKLPYVDPARIYLGGHSTGGTLALLTAECTGRFRAVFSFGPVDDVSGYGPEYLPFDASIDREVELRSPVLWLASITSPVFVVEGARQGNADSLRTLARTSQNPHLRCVEVPGGNHFDVLAPANALLARKILGDSGPSCSITLDANEIRVRR
jgi:dipeptidyl aminopeptidase/acylaminoacyl peptidase